MAINKSIFNSTVKIFTTLIFILPSLFVVSTFLVKQNSNDQVLADQNLEGNLEKYAIDDLNLDEQRINEAKTYLDKQAAENEAKKIEDEKKLIEEQKKQAEVARQKAIKLAQTKLLLKYSNVGNSEVAQMIRAKFGSNADKALAVANCESGLDANDIGDKKLQFMKNGVLYGASYGIFQIRYLPGRPDPNWLLNPQNNIDKAFEMSAGGTKWSAWSCARKLGIN